MYLHDGKCLDLARVWDMWTGTQVNERTTSIDSGTPTVADLVPDKVDLVLAILEHFKQSLLVQIQSLERLLVLNDSLSNLFQRNIIIGRNCTTAASTGRRHARKYRSIAIS